METKAAAPAVRPELPEEDERMDPISYLSVDAIGEIISLLPTKDAARTQTLSSRWRRLWRSAPLNLDHRDLQWPRYDEEDLAGIISRILASHPGPARRLSVPIVHLRRRPDTVDAWLRSPALHGLRELEFDIGGLYEFAPDLPLPASAFRFSDTLVVTTFAKCRVPDGGGALCFPQIRRLGLEDVVISEESLHGAIAGCPLLESLLLTGRSRFSCIRINSPTLVSLGLRVYTEELVIEDAPLLERLLQLEFRIATQLSVISAPKLETVDCLSDLDYYNKLTSQATELQELSADSSVMVVGSVKNLSINIPSLSIDMFVDLMRCFPCLDKLYIQTRNVSGNKDLWHDDVIKSLDIRLKTVALRTYIATWSQVNLATFFVLNAKMLELMICDGRHSGRRRFIKDQKTLLQLEKRASRGAQFHFTSSTCYHFLPRISHVRDLSKADLFKCDSDCTF
ncbi:unnamed protein product [Urochloa decumbens]|uniref:FBD domain-containing protein n=1 Tax=Urochloa decumbens TaxID=240449 RepID=A0ABC9DXK0_9POAL